LDHITFINIAGDHEDDLAAFRPLFSHFRELNLIFGSGIYGLGASDFKLVAILHADKYYNNSAARNDMVYFLNSGVREIERRLRRDFERGKRSGSIKEGVGLKDYFEKSLAHDNIIGLGYVNLRQSDDNPANLEINWEAFKTDI
jgi:hypothetical protein